MRRTPAKTILEKSKKILWGLLLVFFVIVVRVWFLAIVLHENKLQEARRPQKRKVVEKAERASIYDRFGEVMATNTVQYNVGICYGQMRHIPRYMTKRDDKGKKIRCYPRKDYITALSQLLEQELGLHAERVEDEIYAKAAILGQAPYMLKLDISEEAYFRLNMLEKDWPGLITELSAKRCYPKQSVAADIVGYLGPISRSHYEAILQEMKILKEALDEDPDQQQLRDRLSELEKLAYTINDLTGKIGVEATCDEQLRGKTGKRLYLTDIKGNYIRELEGSYPPIAGQSIKLTISSQLQEYAERLLAQYSQEPPSLQASSLAKNKCVPEQRPWIKEGAIVVLDPRSGEILALASHPRFNPCDFMASTNIEEQQQKQWRVGQWLESDGYLAAVWDRQVPLIREKFDIFKGEFYEEENYLDWSLYLNMILPEHSAVLKTLNKHASLQDAILVQNAISHLLQIFNPLSAAKIIDLLYADSEEDLTGTLITLQEKDLFQDKLLNNPEIKSCTDFLIQYFKDLHSNHDKLLLVDLYRLVIDPSFFSQEVFDRYAALTLNEYRILTTQFTSVQQAIKEILKPWFHEYAFKQWRQEEFKNFLAKQRKEEKAAGRKYAKPYLDYLDEEEERQFREFWDQNKLALVMLFLQGGEVPGNLIPYVEKIKSKQAELAKIKECEAVWQYDYLALQQKFIDLDPAVLQGLLKTFRPFDQLRRPLYGIYPQLRHDPQTNERFECHLAQGFYPRYGYGYLRSHAFRQAATVGSLFKLIPGYAALCQEYQSHKAESLNPLTIVDSKHHIAGKKGGWYVGFFPDGRPIPLYYHGGRLPRSEHFGVGKVDLAKALEVSSNPYFALLAGEVLEDPEDLCHAARLFGFGEKTGIDLIGEYGGNIPQDVSYNKTGLYAMAIGQHTLLATPLQAAVMLSALVNGGKVLKPKILATEPTICRWQVFLPEAVKRPLLEGMRGVMLGDKGTARFACSKFPSDLITQTIGKTSTAEVLDSFGCDSLSKQVKNKEIWFGAITFEPQDERRYIYPELVVIVYLKHGEFGRHAVPYALKMAQKWRQIKQTEQVATRK
ncbi:MAG: peptidase [Verrucomicrobia bacterium]|nr:peptidase [Verrucomicrobiota bacterium]MBS0645660.1 peptidase [Verrucomicrobiota bacterium]